MKSTALKLFCKAFLLFIVINTITGFNYKKTCPNIGLDNTLGCTVTYDLFITDVPGSCLPANVCNNAIGLTIPGNNNITLPCGGCATQCNIIITITDIGGTSLSPAIVADFSSTSPVTLPASLCGGTANSIVYNTSLQKFIIS